jgi:hypothetical protein
VRRRGEERARGERKKMKGVGLKGKVRRDEKGDEGRRGVALVT